MEPEGHGAAGVVEVHFWVGTLDRPDGQWRCPHNHQDQAQAQGCAEEEQRTGRFSFGLTLRELRQAAGLSLEQVADSAEGINESTLSRLERGETFGLHWYSIQTLLERYRVPRDRQLELIDWYRQIRAQRQQRRAERTRAAKASKHL